MDQVLSIALPELTLAGGALALLVLGALGGPKSSGFIGFLAIGVLAAAAYFAAVGDLGVLFHGSFIADPAAAFAKVAIYGLSAVAVLLGVPWLSRKKAPAFEYPVLILLAALGMGMMVSSGDLISTYVGIELQSLALYVLCAFRRDDARASEAGLKYFVLGALSSGLLLYGASLIYGFAGSVRFVDIAAAVHAHPGSGVVFGLVFLMCGLAFKVSAAPFHMWTPDVYEGAPTPVTAFITAAPKLAAMVLFARALMQAFPHAVFEWRQVLVAIAMISVTVGAFGGLVQKNLKRLLAYSSIANIGYALLGLAAGTQAGFQSMLIFMVLYSIDVTAFFACLIALNRGGQAMETLPSMAGLRRVRPGLAVAITILSLSFLGLPPFSGFFGKFYVFGAAVRDPQLAPFAAYGLVMSVVAAFYYLRIIKTMWLDEAPGETDAPALDARAVALVGAAFSGVVVWFALSPLDSYASAAAKAFGL